MCGMQESENEKNWSVVEIKDVISTRTMVHIFFREILNMNHLYRYQGNC